MKEMSFQQPMRKHVGLMGFLSAKSNNGSGNNWRQR